MPDLFNLYSEFIFRYTEEQGGISLNGENITNIRYADDAVLMAYSQEELHNLLNAVESALDWQRRL